MTIRFQCAACQFGLSAPDDKAGLAVKCPKCKAPVVIPLMAEADDAIEVLPALPAVAAPYAFDDVRVGPGVPMLQEARGAYANCPFCGCPGHADKVSFTWWGGLVGPALFSHVKCRSCRRKYNGKSGKSNDTAIAIYIGVSFAIFLFLAGCAAILELSKGR